MTQIDKELLLKDLCSRLPYGVRCSFGVDDAVYEITGINLTCCGASEIQATHVKSSVNGDFSLSSCKPYLFPLSSMTEEDHNTYFKIWEYTGKAAYLNGCHHLVSTIKAYKTANDYLLSKHYDVDGLIPKGLANDATGKNIY